MVGGVIYLSKGSFAAPTPPLRNMTPAPRNISSLQLLRGSGLMSPSPPTINSWWVQASAGRQHCSEFTSEAAISSPEENSSELSSASSGFCFLSDPSSISLPELWKEWRQTLSSHQFSAVCVLIILNISNGLLS